MNLGFKGGIIFDNEIIIKDEKKKGFPYYMRALQLLAVILGCYSTLSIWAEALGVSYNQHTVYLVMLISSIVAFLYMVFPSYDLVKAILTILFYGLFFYSRLDKIKNGFYIIENLVIERIDAYYGIQSLHYIANMTNATRDITLLLSMILVPLSMLYAAGIIRSRCISLCNLFLLFPVAASFAFGLIPSEKYLVAYLMITLYLSISYINFHAFADKEQRKILQRVKMKAALTLSLIGVILFFLLRSVVPEQKYNEVTKIKEVKAELQTYLLHFSLEDVTRKIETLSIFPKEQASGGLNQGQLGRVDEIKYNYKEHLHIWAPQSSLAEGMYLKGYAGSDYTGDSWNGHSKEDKLLYEDMVRDIEKEKFAPVNQVSTMLFDIAKLSNTNHINTKLDTKEKKFRFDLGSIKIKYTGADKKFLYSPYFTDYNLTNDEEYRGDLYAAPVTKKDNYKFDFYYGILFNQDLSSLTALNAEKELREFSAYEKIYRNYVYQVYTALPEKGLEQLKQDFSADNPKIKKLSVKKKIEYVKNYLNANTNYTLAPGKLPKGKDFVEYFLYESKKGYCTHYASAAALMLRAMGVPARYVEGYVVGTSDIIKNQKKEEQSVSSYYDQKVYKANKKQVEASIKDKNAHAWVEVYIDGCGFVPVEFTKGVTIPNTISKIDDMSSVGNELDKNRKLDVTPTLSPKQKNSNKYEENKKPTISATHKNTDKFGSLKNTAQILRLARKNVNKFILFGLIAGAFAVIISIYIRIRKKKAAKHTKNNSKRALLLYEEIEKMLSICNAFQGKNLEDHLDEVMIFCSDENQIAFTSCMEAVRKARFGKECISENELNEIEGFHSYLYGTALPKLSIIKRIYLKLILSV